MNKTITTNQFFITLGLIILGFLIPTNVNATHVMGSDITWRHLQSDVYEITLKYYRDCKGIASTTSNNVRFSCTSGGAIITYSQSLPIVGINNVSNYCLTSTSCGSTPNTAMSGDGVEEIVYRGTVNFNAGQLKAMRDSGCCRFRLDFGECCRNGEITTGSANNNFSTDSEIDLCNIQNSVIPTKDDSPTFKNIPIWNLCCNQTMTYNNGTFDANGDSLVFSLVPAQSAPNFSVPYNSPFNPVTWPMTGYCPNTTPCSCNKSANPIRGFCFDTKTGDISFTPTDCSEVGIFVLKVEQFRREVGGNNWLYIGYTKRDLQWKVKSCINNIPSFEPVADTIVCAGDSVCIDVLARDKQFSNQNWIDTLDLTWNQSIPSAYFYQDTHQIVITNGDTFSIREGKLCWQTTEEDARQAPHYFSFMAKDKACPVNMISSIGSSIRVLPNSQVIIDSIYGPDSTSQNGNRYYVLNSFQNYNYQWSIVNGTIDSGQGTTEVFVKWAGNPTGSGSLKLVYGPNNSQCGSQDSLQIMHYVVSTPSILLQNGINIYPNPVNKTLHIESKIPLSNLVIMDSKGSIVFQGGISNQVDVSGLKAGVYILQLYDSEGNMYAHKFVKE